MCHRVLRRPNGRMGRSTGCGLSERRRSGDGLVLRDGRRRGIAERGSGFGRIHGGLLVRHAQHDLTVIAQVNRSELRILPLPLGQMLLVPLIAFQKVALSKMHQQAGVLCRHHCTEILGIRKIDFTELGRSLDAGRAPAPHKLLVEPHARGAEGRRIGQGDAGDDGE